MCEWLCSTEWTDVQLHCGGRVFPAHRAVLASVSTFLRHILLSCPTEDAPTSVILPGFDLDAMASVLYYIYNGEVVIERHKLEVFMEIIKAMQIFVDEQYLPNTCKRAESASLSLSFLNEGAQKTYEVFSLGDSTDGSYINLKKGVLTECKLIKKPRNDLDFRDKQIKCTGGSRQTSFALKDQERSFLHDLFIETYPRNGNSNGRAASVLAIQRERYHAGASELLTNANGKHLQINNTLSDTHKIRTHLPQWIHPYTLDQNKLSNFLGNDSRSLNFTKFPQMKTIDSTSYYNQQLLVAPKTDLSYHSQTLHSGIQIFKENTTLEFDIINTHPTNMIQKCFNMIDGYKTNHLDGRDLHFDRRCKTVSKAAVLNQVLDSPWRPKQPANYKPFRRKSQDSTRTQMETLKESALSDNNNNIQTSPSTEIVESISANAPTTEPLNIVSGLPIGVTLKCTICDQMFTTNEDLFAHMRRHSSPARYSCPECSKSFSQLRNFKYHMSVHRGTREFAATCTVCGKYFNDRGYLSSHMKIHRNRKEYKCALCPKSFNQRVAYNMHVRIHTGIKPHVCDECGKAFSRKMLLKQHQRTHSGERPYACLHCDKRFADRSNMTLHLRLHSGIKPFSCTLCPKSFTKKHHLKSHLNFHTGAKPYSCPKCKLAFTQSSNMRTHYKKCTAPEQINTAETQSGA